MPPGIATRRRFLCHRIITIALQCIVFANCLLTSNLEFSIMKSRSNKKSRDRAGEERKMDVRCIFVENLGSGDAHTTRICTQSLEAAEQLYLKLRSADRVSGYYPQAYLSINSGPWFCGGCYNFASSVGDVYRGWRNWEKNWNSGLVQSQVYTEADLRENPADKNGFFDFSSY